MTGNQVMGIAPACTRRWTARSCRSHRWCPSGLGVALTPLFVVDDLLADGSAVELLKAHLPAAHTVYGVVAHHRHMPKKVSVFYDFAAAALA